MSSPEPAAARQYFARRLREIRVTRGFKTARSLALALAIDENRYTRYERAEVEPDIELIQRICATLRVSPNDLLGTNADAYGHSKPAQPLAGFAEAETRLAGSLDDDAPMPRDQVTWTLACAVAELQSQGVGGNVAGSPPLAMLQQAARLFTDLERRPFAAVSEILLLPAVATAPAAQAQRISKLIQALTSSAA